MLFRSTFGIVLLEAAASGLPVAAFPVQGPSDVFAGSEAAVLHEDLRSAALSALRLPREAGLQLAQRHSWHSSAEQFYGHMRRAMQTAAAGKAARVEPAPASTALSVRLEPAEGKEFA